MHSAAWDDEDVDDAEVEAWDEEKESKPATVHVQGERKKKTQAQVSRCFCAASLWQHKTVYRLLCDICE